MSWDQPPVGNPSFGDIENTGRYRLISGHTSSKHDEYAAVRVDLQPNSVRFYAMVGAAKGTGHSDAVAATTVHGSFEVVPEAGEVMGQQITL